MRTAYIAGQMVSFITLMLVEGTVTAQEDSTHQEHKRTINYYTELRAGVLSGAVPFWLRTNQFGNIPLEGFSSTGIGGINRQYEPGKKKIIDWGFGLEGIINTGKQTNGILTEAFVKGRLSIFQLKAGRSKDIIGITDSTLGSGSFAVSGNSLGIPKLELSIPEYWPIPFTHKLISVKGSIAHGWLGDKVLRTAPYTVAEKVNSYYHQLTIYGQLGKPQWKLKFFGGFNHLVTWGNEKKIYGPDKYDLNNLQTFYYIALGKPYTKAPTGTSKIGNHLGSIDQSIAYDFGRLNLSLYHQFFYDVGGLYHGNNLKDGLWGLSLRIADKGRSITVSGINIEFWGSKSQGGEESAAITPSGDEDYYNNYLYYEAWSYKGENIGNNFLTNRKYTRSNLPNREKEYVINSRVIMWHAGIQGRVGRWLYLGKFSYSTNYGTYGSSPWGNSTGTHRVPGPPPYFERVSQFSGYARVEKPLQKNFRLIFQLALDNGGLLPNATGATISIAKHW